MDQLFIAIAQLGVMYGAGMALWEAIKLLYENVTGNELKIGILQIGLVLTGIAFGILWDVSILEMISLPPTVSPIADKVFNVVFMGVTFLLGPTIIHDLARKAQGDASAIITTSGYWDTSGGLDFEVDRPTDAVAE